MYKILSLLEWCPGFDEKRCVKKVPVSVNTGSLLTRDTFDKLFGFLYFNLTYKSVSITAPPTQIVLRYKLSSASAAGSNYKVYAIILYKEEVRIDPIGNEILII